MACRHLSQTPTSHDMTHPVDFGWPCVRGGGSREGELEALVAARHQDMPLLHWRGASARVLWPPIWLQLCAINTPSGVAPGESHAAPTGVRAFRAESEHARSDPKRGRCRCVDMANGASSREASLGEHARACRVCTLARSRHLRHLLPARQLKLSGLSAALQTTSRIIADLRLRQKAATGPSQPWCKNTVHGARPQGLSTVTEARAPHWVWRAASACSRFREAATTLRGATSRTRCSGPFERPGRPSGVSLQNQAPRVGQWSCSGRRIHVRSEARGRSAEGDEGAAPGAGDRRGRAGRRLRPRHARGSAGAAGGRHRERAVPRMCPGRSSAAPTAPPS
jgi:hypothetical protein